MKTFKLWITAAAVSLMASGLAMAQDYQMQPPQHETIEVSDQQLQQFATAQVEITRINQDFTGRLQNVDDPEKAYELQMEANEEMTQAVEDAGLNVESFNEIAMAIQSDPELQQRLGAMLER